MASVKAATGSNLVKYGSYTMDAAAEEQEDLEKSGGGAFFKPKDGRNPMRFLPPPIGKRSPFVLTYQHFVQLPGMASGASFNCPKMMAKQACPVCQKIEELRGTGAAADYDLAGKMLARVRVYANIIARAEPEIGPQVYAFGKQVHEQLVTLRQDEDAGGDFTHPIDGFDIIVNKSGKDLNTNYKVQASRDTSELGDMTWIEQQADLERYAQVPSAGDIMAKMGIGGAAGGSRAGRGGGPARSPRGNVPAQAAPGRARGRSAEADIEEVQEEEQPE